MNEKKPDNETVVRQDAPGEDWLNGRGAFCGRCGGKDNKPTVAWDASEGCVRCSECVYINPDATREAVLFLLEQRVADGDALREGDKELTAATKKIEKLEADLKEARAKSKTAKVEADPEPVKVAKKE